MAKTLMADALAGGGPVAAGDERGQSRRPAGLAREAIIPPQQQLRGPDRLIRHQRDMVGAHPQVAGPDPGAGHAEGARFVRRPGKVARLARQTDGAGQHDFFGQCGAVLVALDAFGGRHGRQQGVQAGRDGGFLETPGAGDDQMALV